MTCHAQRGLPSWVVLLASTWALSACTPPLNWRDVRPAESGLLLQLPCKPTAQQRQVALAGPAVPLRLHACSAEGQTWALAFAEMGDPVRVGPALAELARAAAANVGAAAGLPQPMPVPGATPNLGSGRLRLLGHLPDGAPVQLQVAVFARGTRVFQATVVGARVADEAADIFFASLRLDR